MWYFCKTPSANSNNYQISWVFPPKICLMLSPSDTQMKPLSSLIHVFHVKQQIEALCPRQVSSGQIHTVWVHFFRAQQDKSWESWLSHLATAFSCVCFVCVCLCDVKHVKENLRLCWWNVKQQGADRRRFKTTEGSKWSVKGSQWCQNHFPCIFSQLLRFLL